MFHVDPNIYSCVRYEFKTQSDDKFNTFITDFETKENTFKQTMKTKMNISKKKYG